MTRLAALISALLLALPAQADETDRRLAALLLLEQAADDALIFRLSAGPVRMLMEASAEARPGLSPQQMMVLSALYHEEMHAAALAALRNRAGELAARYSLAELRALNRFAETEDGLALLAEDGGPAGGLARSIEAAMLARMDDAFDRHAGTE